ncbi:HIT-like protein [Agrocybe pediades]|nr:HIT-like protein [Agrocybe pediades]
MTSFIIKAHEERPAHREWAQDAECAFCRIIRGELPASKVYEDDKVMAILDIMPLREGHTLVIPKAHISRVSELPAELAAAIGETVSKVAHALTLGKSLDHTGLNVVCNQEYAQAVPHVHYHIIPAPKFGAESAKGVEATDKPVGGKAPLTRREMHQKEFEAREELDEDDAKALLPRIRSHL